MGRKGGAENWVELSSPILIDQSERDEAAFKILSRGVQAWELAIENQEYPFDVESYSPCLEGREFIDIKFSGWNFFGSARNSKFHGCFFEGCDFDYANLEGCEFKSVGAMDSTFCGAYLDNSSANQCSFEACNFEDISWLDGKITDVSFRWSDFTEAVFDGSLLENVDFRKSSGRIASFNDSRMFGISWLGCKFIETSFERVIMPRHPLYMGVTTFDEMGEGDEEEDFPYIGADLSGSWFHDSNLSGLDFRESNLRNTLFYCCDLTGVNMQESKGVWAGAFRGADLSGAQLPSNISFENVTRKIEATVSLARPAYLTNIVTCVAVFLAIVVASGTTTIKLPFFGVPVDSNSFAIYGLIQSAIISFYVGMYLVRIWEGASELPAIHPNGVTTPDLISPWTAISPIWYYLRVRKSRGRLRPPQGYKWQFFMALISHWFVTPITAAFVAFEFVGISNPTAYICLFISGAALAGNVWLYHVGTGVLKGSWVTASE